MFLGPVWNGGLLVGLVLTRDPRCEVVTLVGGNMTSAAYARGWALGSVLTSVLRLSSTQAPLYSLSPHIQIHRYVFNVHIRVYLYI